MMGGVILKIVALIKQLNNTELGKGGTHDCYVLIPAGIDILDLIPVVGAEVEFCCKQDQSKIKLRYTEGNEKRIVGLGPLYSKYDLCAGDEIVFEHILEKDSDKYFVNIKKYTDIVVVQKLKYGFEVLTENGAELLEKFYGDNNLEKICSLEFVVSAQKRSDSPVRTKFYDLVFHGKKVTSNFANKTVLKIIMDKECVRLEPFFGCKKYSVDMEDSNE